MKFNPSEKEKKEGIMANMKKLFIVAMAIGLTLTAITAFAQTAKEAIYGLKKLEARVEAGISYRDYSPALGEAKFPVNLYLESQEAKNNPELASLIEKVMVHYEQAGFVFKEKIEGPYRYLDHVSSFQNKQKAINEQNTYKSLIEQYPEANKFIEDGGALGRDKSDQGKDINNLKYGRVLNLNYLFPKILKKASIDLKDASMLLSRAKEINAQNTQNEIEKLKTENANLRKQLEEMNAGMKSKKKK
jgi:hypothetical protein